MNRVSILTTSRFLETEKREQHKYENTDLSEHRHLWITQKMICVLKSRLKTVRKTKITFLLSKTFLF